MVEGRSRVQFVAVTYDVVDFAEETPVIGDLSLIGYRNWKCRFTDRRLNIIKRNDISKFLPAVLLRAQILERRDHYPSFFARILFDNKNLIFRPFTALGAFNKIVP